MVKALLGAGASVDLPSLRDGNPLIMAAQRGHHAVVDALIEAGADVNAVVPYDETPLITAVRAGQFEIVQCLVEKGADVNLGVHADFGLRSPLNQARDSATRDYLIRMGAQAKPTGA
jgi:ankyrin repeat protein